ncbi:MAG: glycine zipper 2TM domain-containing protein [Alphaproteobacteria bacterium]|nr:glycine zipper 2TM domain-containing protein [Alphaproteobacteria bacterium]
MIRIAVVATGVAVALAGCSGTGGYKEPAGAILGGAAGGLLGSNIGSGSGRLAATAAGAVLGAVLGSDTGRSLHRADSLYYGRSLAAPAQVPVPGQPTYAAPAVPHYVPPPTGSVAGPQNCQALARPPGATTSYACQSIDGTWFIAR